MPRRSLPRHASLAALVLALGVGAAACAADSAPGGSGLQPAPTGGGYCCPVESITCDCFRNGGWVAVDDLEQCPRLCDLAPPGSRLTPDEHGCPELTGPTSCLSMAR